MSQAGSLGGGTVGRHAGRGEHHIGVEGDPVVERDRPVVDRLDRDAADVADARLVEQPEQSRACLGAQSRFLGQVLCGDHGHVDALQRHRGRGLAADEAGTDDDRRPRVSASMAKAGGVGQRP